MKSPIEKSLSNDERSTIASYLRVAAERFEEHVNTLNDFTRVGLSRSCNGQSLQEQFRKQALEARAMANRIDNADEVVIREGREDMLNELGKSIGPTCGVWDTGGGCQAFCCSFPDGTKAMATDEYGAELPEDLEAGPWVIGFYDCEGQQTDEAMIHDQTLEQVVEVFQALICRSL